MGNLKLASNLSIPANDYANQGNSIIGIRGSGKTYTATKTAEELMKAGVPVIAFDPTGVWQNLRNGTEGKPGFPVVVAGGMSGDIPLTEENATRIVDAALKEGVSLVIDLLGISTSNKSKWRRIVSDCVEFLMEENINYGLRHVFIEEAAEFVPQKIDQGGQLVYSRIESMCRIGRNFGLGYTLINQRAEEIAKAVFELSEMVLVHRQGGKNSLNSIHDWLKVKGLKESGIVASLPQLADGECWAIDGQRELRIQVLTKQTFHPNPKKGLVKAPAKSAADVSGFVDRMKVLLQEQDTKKPSPETDQKGLQIRTLELQQAADDAREEAAYWKAEYHALVEALGTLAANTLHKAGPAAAQALQPMTEQLVESPVIRKGNDTAVKSSKVNSGAARMLKAAAMFHPGSISKMRMAALAGMSHRSGTFSNYLSQLRQAGHIEDAGDKLYKATTEGVKHAGDFHPLPTAPAELIEMWCGVVGSSSGASRILRILGKVYPNTLKKPALAAQAGMSSSSGTYSNYLSVLRRNGLIQETKTGIKAADELFN